MLHTPVQQEELSDALLDFKGSSVYWLPLLDIRGNDVGNNGDTLIELGSRKFGKEAGLIDDVSPLTADVLLVRGGGRMSGYRRAHHLISRLWNEFPDKPLLIFPSSFYFPNGDFAKSLGPRSAPTYLFCREQASFEHIRPQLPEFVELRQGHDMAFCLSEDDFGPKQEPQHVLAVERKDYEHPSNDLAMPTAKEPTFNFKASLLSQLPTPASRWLRNRLRPEVAEANFKLFVEALVKEHGGPELPVKYGDISNQRRYSQTHFYDSIKGSELTVTTRLHVGILSALLGIETKIIAGPYHKLRGIYDRSMTDMNNVELIDGIW